MTTFTKQTIFQILFVCMLFCIPFGTANAAIDRNYPVTEMSGVAITKEATPVYFYADTSKTVSTLQTGTQLIITGKANGYYQIKHEGTKAYVNPKFTERYQDLTYFSLLGKLTADTAVYLIADTSKPIGTLKTGAKVMIIGKANGYYEIYYGDQVAFIAPKNITDFYPLKEMDQYGTVIKDMTVYTYADTSSVRGAVEASQKITVTGKANGYYRIKYGASHGFIDAKNIGLHYEVAELNKIGIVNKEATVYQFADTSHTLGTVKSYQKVTVTGKSNGYYRIKYGDSHGFVDAKLINDNYSVEEMDTYGTAVKDLTVYVYADTSAKRGEIKKDQRITITGKSNGYYRIKYSDSYGFVDAKYIGIDYPTEAVNKIGIASQNMVVYTFADTSYERGTLDKGQKITVVGKSNGYYKIKFSDSYGFVDSKLIQNNYAVEEMSNYGTAIKNVTAYTYADTSDIRGSLKVNQRITITGKSNGYYRIKYSDSYAFVDMKAISPDYPIVTMKQTGKTIKAVTIYQFADTMKKITTIKANQTVSVTGKSNGYYRIKYDSTVGYVDAKQIGLQYTVTSLNQIGVAIHQVTAYSFADTSHERGTIKANQKITVTGKANGYYRIKYNDSHAFVDASEIGLEYKVTTMNQYGYARKDVVAYSFADTSHVRGSLVEDQKITITGLSNGYYRIKYSDSHAFVDAKQIRLDYPITELELNGVLLKALKVYRYADTSEQLGSLAANKKVAITGKANGYYQIVYGTSFGYIDSKQVGILYDEEKLSEKGTSLKNVKMYKFADTTQLLKKITKATSLKITAEANGYYKVNDGKHTGYIKTTDIVLSKTVKPYKGIGVLQAANKAYISASTKSKSTGTLKKGTKVYITGISGTWYQIKSGKSYEYISNKNIKITANETESKVAREASIKKAASMLDSANAQGTATATIAKGAFVEVVGKTKSFYKVKYKNKTGYITIANADLHEKSTDAAEASIVVSFKTSKVYSHPSKYSKHEGEIESYQAALIQKVTKNWYGIIGDDNKLYWISKSDVVYGGQNKTTKFSKVEVDLSYKGVAVILKNVTYLNNQNIYKALDMYNSDLKVVKLGVLATDVHAAVSGVTAVREAGLKVLSGTQAVKDILNSAFEEAFLSFGLTDVFSVENEKEVIEELRQLEKEGKGAILTKELSFNLGLKNGFEFRTYVEEQK